MGGGSAAGTLQQVMLPVAERSTCSRVSRRLVPVDERSWSVREVKAKVDVG